MGNAKHCQNPYEKSDYERCKNDLRWWECLNILVSIKIVKLEV